MDRGYIDFERLFALTLSSAFFVVRTKSNVLLSGATHIPLTKAPAFAPIRLLSSHPSDQRRRIPIHFDA